MQARLTPGDRKLITIAAAALAFLAIASVLVAPSPETKLTSIPSTYLSTPGGARAAYLLLQRLGTRVQRWQEPPFRLLEQRPADATLVLAEPAQTPSHAEARALRRFVEAGGRVLFCGRQLSSFFPETSIQSWDIPAALYQPVLKDKSAQPIEIRTDATWSRLGPNQLPVYANSADAVVVVAWTLGTGEVIWWASASPLTNAGLDRAGNLALFLNSIGSRTVLWDEYFHGETGSLWDYAGRISAVRWSVVQFCLLAAAAFFAFSRRSGPIVALAATSRLSPLEFVDTLGGLYRRANAFSVPVDIALSQLRLQLTRKLALPITIGDADLAHAAAQRLGWNAAELESVLSRSKAPVNSKSALESVRSLQTYTWNI